MKEPSSTDGQDNGSGQPVEACFSLTAAPMDQIEVRSAATDLSAYEVYENKIKELVVAQYVDSVAVYVARYEDMSKVNLRDIPVTLQESPSHVYFLVNTLSADGGKTLEVNVGDLEKKLMTEELSFPDKFIQVSDGTTIAPMPMAGVWRGTPRGGSIPVPVKVYRALAKITLTLSAELPAGDKFNLRQAYVAAYAQGYVDEFWRDPEKLDGEGVAPYGAIIPADSYARDKNMIYKHGELVGNPLTVCSYMGEAYYGYGNKGTAKYQKEKTAETGPRIPGVPAEKTGYTYLRILGDYTDAQTGIVMPLVYNIYLGGNNTDDYNILRNHHYKVSVTLMGKSKTDVRIEWNGNVGSIDDYSVIRYAQQNRIQQMQAAKVASGLSWGKIYPGYDVSTGKGTGTGLDGSIAKANWKMSSLSDLMILYAYFRLSTNTWAGQISSGDESQAFSVAANGTVTATDTTNTYDFYATWGNTLDATVEKKYPYLSADRPVIVSMENDGTGIKAIGLYGASSSSLRKNDSLYLEDPVSKAFLMNQTAQPVYNEAGWFKRESATNNRVPGKLMVAKADAGSGKMFTEAYDICKAYSEPDYPAGSWRLPTQRELILINAFFDELSAQPGFTAFTPFQGYWSGTEFSGDSNNAWRCIPTGDAERIINTDQKISQNNVRCVRSMIQVYPYISGDNRIITSDPDGGLPASSLLTAEQKTWLNTHNVCSAQDGEIYFEDSEYNKVSSGARIAAVNCNPTNAPGVDVIGPTEARYRYKPTTAYLACKAYREAPDGTDAGTWRLPTQAEILSPGFYDLVKSNTGGVAPAPPFFVFSGTLYKAGFSFDGRPLDSYPYWAYNPSGTLGPAVQQLVVRCVRDE